MSVIEFFCLFFEGFNGPKNVKQSKMVAIFDPKNANSWVKSLPKEHINQISEYLHQRSSPERTTGTQ